MIFTIQKADRLGAVSSILCLIHCIATPFIFMAQTSLLTCCSSTPGWWKLTDYIFLAISFLAVYCSTHTTANTWIKPALWISWSLLFFIIINEKATWVSLQENVIFIPTLSLILLHLYNRKYCKCDTDTCCIH
ncbi:MerC domain-containing protein [Formosa agariphila]|uniref:MerC domain-containing protein n=1 Tax=Formosa agariphila TaxID=320324 RepID=UPI000A0123CD|nr:MerC domain-containing protein [Formosa agariphila]